MESLANMANTVECITRNVNRANWSDALSAYGLEFIGSGMSRMVFGWGDKVIKVIRQDTNTDNHAEMATWNAVKHIPKLANLLARPLYISPCGRVLIMERAETTVCHLKRRAQQSYRYDRDRRLTLLCAAIENRWIRANRESGWIVANVEKDCHSGNIARMRNGAYKIIDYGFASFDKHAIQVYAHEEECGDYDHL